MIFESEIIIYYLKKHKIKPYNLKVDGFGKNTVYYSYYYNNELIWSSMPYDKYLILKRNFRIKQLKNGN
jgi:hypothetical protein